MMENIFCLFGFSGDDPNFLQWSGWVRDALGEHAPVIYLIGVLELSDSRRKFLEGRNVIPLDLGQAFPEVPHAPPGERHKAALEWILLSLAAGQPVSNTNWPDISKRHTPKPLYSDTAPLKPQAEPKQFMLPRRLSNSSGMSLHGLYETLKRGRESYPGWLVLPESRRRILWFQILEYYHDLPTTKSIWKQAEALEPHQAMLLLSEMVWITERCLTPLISSQSEVIKSVLERVNPFPEVLDLESAELAAQQDQSLRWDESGLDWRTIAEAWTHLAFALLRMAREYLDVGAFSLWRERLSPLRGLRSKWAARWSHEITQYHLARLEEDQARQHLQVWPETPDLPEWTLRRASAHAELGDLEKAQALATDAVNRVRRALQEDEENVRLLSIESWALYALQAYAHGITFIHYKDDMLREQLGADRAAYAERLAALQPYRCNPQSERNQLELKVGGPKPTLQLDQERREEKQSFDPGESQTVTSIGGSNYFEGVLPAFGLLKLSEKGGYPVRSPNFITLSELGRAAEWIWPLSPLGAISSYLRAGKKDEFERWFTRARVAILGNEQVGTLLEMLLSAGRSALSALEKASVPSRSYAHEALPKILETLSRLCFQLDTQLNEVLDFALEAYKSPTVQRDFIYYDPLQRFIKRTLSAMTLSQQLAALPKLLDSPFLIEEERNRPHSNRWPEPSLHLIATDLPKSNEEMRSRLQTSIVQLMGHVKDSDSQTRWRALLRLMIVAELEALSPEQHQRFAEAVWSRVDKFGLPEDTNMTSGSVLHLPEVEIGQAERAIQNFLRSRVIEPIVTRNGDNLTSSGGFNGNEVLRAWLQVNTISKDGNESQGIDFTADDVEVLIDKLLDWTRKEIEFNGEQREVFGSYFDDRLHLLDHCFAHIIYPRADQLSEQGRQDLATLRDASEAYGFRPIVSLPASLNLEKTKDNVTAVARQLRILLSSFEETDVSHTLEAIQSWSRLAQHDIIPPLPEGLLRELGAKLLMRRDPKLIRAIKITTEIVGEAPSWISSELQNDLLQALDNLLPEVELPPDFIGLDAVSNRRQVFSMEERPDAFAAAAKLAATLQRTLLSRGQDIPEILGVWRQKAMESVLPELREVFVDFKDE